MQSVVEDEGVIEEELAKEAERAARLDKMIMEMRSRPATRKVSEVRPHPDQHRIYGDRPDADLIKSIEKVGVLVPLLISKNNLVLSGCRRWWAAKQAGIEEVPVNIFASENELDIQEAIVHANKTRKKTRGQIAREAAMLLRVEQKRGLERMKEAGERGGEASGEARRGEAKGRATVPDPSPKKEERARDKVGEALGLGGKTAEYAAAVAEEIDKREQEGDQEGAEKLKEILDERGFKPAYDEAKKQSEPAAEPEPEPSPNVALLRKAGQTLTKLKAQLEEAGLENALPHLSKVAAIIAKHRKEVGPGRRRRSARR